MDQIYICGIDTSICRTGCSNQDTWWIQWVGRILGVVNLAMLKEYRDIMEFLLFKKDAVDMNDITRKPRVIEMPPDLGGQLIRL